MLKMLKDVEKVCIQPSMLKTAKTVCCNGYYIHSTLKEALNIIECLYYVLTRVYSIGGMLMMTVMPSSLFQGLNQGLFLHDR